MRLMAVDPAVAHCGVAIFHSDRLTVLRTYAGEGYTEMHRGANVIHHLRVLAVIECVTDVVCERPWSYGQRYKHTWSLFGLADSIKEWAEGQRLSFAWYLPMEFLERRKRRMVALDAKVIEQETGIRPKTTDEWVAYMLGRHHLGLTRMLSLEKV